MKKNGILNREINAVLGRLGHTDTICIADCGLPLPDDVKIVDLSLKLGTPSFLEVLEIIIEEMKIEKYVLACEIMDKNKQLFNNITDKELINVPYDFITHEELKDKTKSCKLIIRTGEASPFANIILQGGVIF